MQACSDPYILGHMREQHSAEKRKSKSTVEKYLKLNGNQNIGEKEQADLSVIK